MKGPPGLRKLARIIKSLAIHISLLSNEIATFLNLSTDVRDIFDKLPL